MVACSPPASSNAGEQPLAQFGGGFLVRNAAGEIDPLVRVGTQIIPAPIRVPRLPHPQIPHQAIQIVRMYSEQPGRPGVIVPGLLKRLHDGLAFGAIDGVL